MVARKQKARTLNDCINDLCNDYVCINNPVIAENFSIKWKSKPSQRARNLFRHWNYISDDAMNLEINSLRDTVTRKSPKRQHESLSSRSITLLSRQESMNNIV
jgi:hypothetical protein